MSQESYTSDISMDGMYEEIADTILDEMEPNIEEEEDDWQVLVTMTAGRMTRSMLTATVNTQQVLETVVSRGGVGRAQRLQNITQLLGLTQDSSHMNDQQMAASLGAIVANEEEDFVGTRYYVRSAQLTAAALRQVVTVYEARFADPYLVEAFNNNILAGTQDDQDVFVRYIGCTTASTPQQREQTDANAVLQTRLGNFMQAAQAAHHPLQFDVYEVPSLRLPQNHALVDVHEQVLLHIFDRQVCLNSQPGGFYRSYQPSNEDNELMLQVLGDGLEQLQDSFFGPAEQEADAVQEAALENLFRELYRTRLPQIDVQRARTIDDDHIHLFATQAFPPRPQGANLSPLLIFAKDITKEDASLLRGFFDGSRAGQLTSDLIASSIGNFANRENFVPPPFFDLFNCQPFARNDGANRVPFEETAAAIVHQVNPLVVSTLGFDPHATAFSNYRGSYSLGLKEHLGHTGQPFLSSGDLEFALEAADGQDPQQMHIVVPHLDPGYVSYGSGDVRILRLMLLTWCRTMLLVSCCLQLANDPNSQLQQGTRAFCVAAINMAEQREDDTGFTQVFNFVRAQVLALTHETARNRREKSLLRAMLRGDPAPGFGFDAITGSIAGSVSVAANVGRFGQAQGEPNSVARMNQCRALERQNYPLLRRLLAFQEHLRNPNPNSDWRTFIGNLEEGASIYHAVLGRCSWNADPLPGLTRGQTHAGLTQCEPPEGWAGGEEWKQDPELVLLAISQRMSRIRQQGIARGITPSDELRELYRRANLLDTTIVPITMFE